MAEKVLVEDPQPGLAPRETGSSAGKSMRDDGADLFHELSNYTREELDAECDSVRRKLDWRIMPLICVTYSLQLLDKLSLNYAAAYSLIPDLGLQGQRYSWVAAIFYFGLLGWSVPGNLLLQRLPVAKYTGCLILGWGILLLCHPAAKNYTGLLILRFLLGMLESNIAPSLMAVMSMFYTRREQPLRMCAFLGFNGSATMLGAALAFGLGKVEHASLKSWQLVFLVIGALNFLWAWVYLAFMPDSPSTAKFLTHKERVVAVYRIADNMTGLKTRQFEWSQALEAVLDFKVQCLCLVGLACGIINGGISSFASSVIRGFGFSGTMANLLQLPAGAVEFIIVPLSGLAATRIKDSRCVIMALISLLPFAGLIGIRFTPIEKKWSLVAGSWLQALVGGPIIMSLNLLTTNIAGHTKRSFANGCWFVFFAGGNIGGANIFFAREAPRYFSAITGLVTSYAGIIVIAIVLRLYMMNENRKRRASTGENALSEAAKEGFADTTDKKNPHFTYAL